MSRDATPYADMRGAHVCVGVTEEWRAVPGFPLFQVSSFGRVANPVGEIKKQATLKTGYLYVGFWQDGKTSCRLVNRIVCEAFHGPAPSRKHHAAHLDGDKLNNRASNLEWKTAKENAADKYLHGTHLQGEKCCWSKLTEADVREIRSAKKWPRVCIDLAAKFGVTKNHIAKIRTPSRGIWPDVPFPDQTNA